MNGCEYQKIKIEDLPSKWQDVSCRENLEQFLQSNWEQRVVFYNDRVITSRQAFIDFEWRGGIKLKNYIGTVCFDGEVLNIFPKMYKNNEDDEEKEEWKTSDLVRNLVIWLKYCEKLNFSFLSIDSTLSNTANLFELLVTIFAHYVKSALDTAAYRCYEDVLETNSLVKGQIDFNIFTCKQMPSGNWHKLPFSYSNFVFDNKLNRILKYTCKLLFHATNERSSKKLLRNLLMRLGDVSNENCTPADCNRIRLNPLHKKYFVLLNMCKMFLLNKTSTCEIGANKSYCFLFPAELLFEGFVGGYLKELFADKAEVHCQASDQFLADLVVDDEVQGQAFLLKEDVLVETKDSIFVVDTKYKEISSFNKIDSDKKLGISDADMKQMAVYAIKRKAKKLFLIYPLYNQSDLETRQIRYDIKLDDSNPQNKIPLEILKVPFVFSENDEITRKQLKTVLDRIVE